MLLSLTSSTNQENGFGINSFSNNNNLTRFSDSSSSRMDFDSIFNNTPGFSDWNPSHSSNSTVAAPTGSVSLNYNTNSSHVDKNNCARCFNKLRRFQISFDKALLVCLDENCVKELNDPVIRVVNADYKELADEKSGESNDSKTSELLEAAFRKHLQAHSTETKVEASPAEANVSTVNQSAPTHTPLTTIQYEPQISFNLDFDLSNVDLLEPIHPVPESYPTLPNLLDPNQNGIMDQATEGHVASNNIEFDDSFFHDFLSADFSDPNTTFTSPAQEPATDTVDFAISTTSNEVKSSISITKLNSANVSASVSTTSVNSSQSGSKSTIKRDLSELDEDSNEDMLTKALKMNLTDNPSRSKSFGVNSESKQTPAQTTPASQTSVLPWEIKTKKSKDSIYRANSSNITAAGTPGRSNSPLLVKQQLSTLTKDAFKSKNSDLQEENDLKKKLLLTSSPSSSSSNFAELLRIKAAASGNGSSSSTSSAAPPAGGYKKLVLSVLKNKK